MYYKVDSSIITNTDDKVFVGFMKEKNTSVFSKQMNKIQENWKYEEGIWPITSTISKLSTFTDCQKITDNPKQGI